MNRVGLASAAVVALLLGAAVLRWMPDERPMAVEGSHKASNDPVGQQRAADVSIVVDPRQELPGLDAPLSAAMPILQSLAASGNAEAACRVATELQGCEDVEKQAQEFDRWISSRKRGLAAVSINATAEKISEFSSVFEREMAERSSRIDDGKAHCAQIAVPDPLSRIENWRRAALLGDASAIRHYASGGVFRRADLVASAPALAAYRAEAERLAIGLAQQGDLEMTLVLAASYSPLHTAGTPVLAQVVQPDRVKALAYYRRVADALRNEDGHEARSLVSRIELQMELNAQSITPAELLRVDAESAAMDAAWQDVRPWFRPTTNAIGEVARVVPRQCGRP